MFHPAKTAQARTASAKKQRRKLDQRWDSDALDPAFFTSGDGHTFNVSGGQVNSLTLASHNKQATRLERVVGAPTALD